MPSPLPCYGPLTRERSVVSEPEGPPLWFASAAEANGESSSCCSSFYPPADAAVAAELVKCGRLLPQDNDTGGFFVALLRKTADYTLGDEEAAEPRKSAVKPGSRREKQEKEKKETEDLGDGLKASGGAGKVPKELLAARAKGGMSDVASAAGSREECAAIREFFGLSSDASARVLAAWPELGVRGADGEGALSETDALTGAARGNVRGYDGLNKIYALSAEAADVALSADCPYTVVGAGSCVLEHTRAKGSGCSHRLTSDAHVWARRHCSGARNLELTAAEWRALLAAFSPKGEGTLI